jgi:hypothetical protein
LVGAGRQRREAAAGVVWGVKAEERPAEDRAARPGRRFLAGEKTAFNRMHVGYVEVRNTTVAQERIQRRSDQLSAPNRTHKSRKEATTTNAGQHLQTPMKAPLPQHSAAPQNALSKKRPFSSFTEGLSGKVTSAYTTWPTPVPSARIFTVLLQQPGPPTLQLL